MTEISGMISAQKLNKVDIAQLENMELNFAGRFRQEEYSLRIEKNFGVVYSSEGVQVYRDNNKCIIVCGTIYGLIDDEVKTISSEMDCEKNILLKISEGYLKYGYKYFSNIDGQFVICIYDFTSNDFVIVTDKYKFIPIYFYVDKKRLYFSTHLPALIKCIDKKTINMAGVYSYFTMQSVLIGQHTLFKEYKKLPAGHGIKIKIDRDSFTYETFKYYFPKFSIDNKNTFELSVRKVKELLLDAIEKRYKPNNTCIWLSGGLDSSLLVAMVRKELGYKPCVFSIGFEGYKDEEGDEFEYSRYVAKKYECHYEEVYFSDEDLKEKIPYYFNTLNEPMISNDYLAHCLLGEVSKLNNFTSVLCGNGADELWYGYDWFKKSFNTKLDRKSLFYDMFFEYSIENISSILNEYIQQECDFRGCVNEYLECLPHSSYECAVIGDLNLILPEDPTKRAYNVSISNGVFIHAPFMSSQLTKLSLSVSHRNKLYAQENKAILKYIASEYFNNEFVYRKKKHFSIPKIKYLSGGAFDFCENVLNDKSCIERGLYNHNYVNLLIKQKKGTVERLGGNLIWELACLEMWLQQFD